MPNVEPIYVIPVTRHQLNLIERRESKRRRREEEKERKEKVKQATLHSFKKDTIQNVGAVVLAGERQAVKLVEHQRLKGVLRMAHQLTVQRDKIIVSIQ